jgi:ERCC4-related helicase
MLENLITAVLGEPNLVSWLKSSLWRLGFDRGSLTRATAYADEEHITITEVDGLPKFSITCEAKVKGSGKGIYTTRVGFFSTGKVWAVRCECGCPVGIYCKHSAGIILLLLEKISPQKVIFSSASAPVPAKLEPWLHSWLEQIKDVSAPTGKPSKPPAEEKRFLAYCITPALGYGTHKRWQFGMRVGTRLKNGSFSISETQAQADPAKPPKYMVAEDFVPAALYHQRKRKKNIWDQMPLDGDGWDKLLETAFATGRVYLSDKNCDIWQTAQAGPDLPVLATWEILADGCAQPRLAFTDELPRLILPTVPLRYMERESGNVGLLTSDLPAAQLLAWFNGSPIPARQVQPISEKLRELAPSLPLPPQVTTLELPAVLPRPHLILRKKYVDVGHDFGNFIIALIHFCYGEGKPLPPLAASQSPVHYEIRDAVRRVQPRDAKAEVAAEKRLERLGFSSLSRYLRTISLVGETRRALLPPDFQDFDSDEMEQPWLVFLASPALAELKQEGWTIEIEPDTGLLIREAGAFFPDIEADPNHGIEWFRFDAQFELEGKKVSLIPYIADAIRRNIPPVGSPDFPEFLVFPCENPADGSIRFPAVPLMEMVEQVRHLFQGHTGDGPVQIDRLGAASVAHALAIDSSETLRSLAKLAQNLLNIQSIPAVPIPKKVTATLRDYQAEGFHWLQFLAENSLHGILADDMGLGKTVQTLTHLAAETAKKPKKPSLVLAPTSVVSNWLAEAEKFTPHLKVVLLHGKDRGDSFRAIPKADLVITSYPLLNRDFEILSKQEWHLCVLDEAQYIKNSKAIIAKNVCKLRASHRLCLSGTPMENHLGELWSLMRFLMPGFLGDETTFNNQFRRPIERDRSRSAQLGLNRRISPLILRRTKDQVATELPPKTEIVHAIDLTKKQTDLYESVRAAMDKRVRDAISDKGLAKSHIIVLDALLKLRQICCHPQLLKNPAAQKVTDSAKLDYLTDQLLPTLLEEGRRILLFSSFTSMLALIEAHLEKQKIPFLKLTGQTQDRASLVKKFQSGEVPVFLISLKAGGTGLNLTAADTVIHYDPWWNPAAENQATDRVHRIGQTKPVFVHKLVCTGTIEDRILDLQKHKSALIEALLSEETSKLKIDSETLSHLLAPLESD